LILHEITVQNQNGLHLRPATLLTQIARKFQSEIKVVYDGKVAGGYNLLDLLKLGVSEGSKITLIIEGPDEREALPELVNVLQDKKLTDDLPIKKG
jgi:phosphotransferase system HPr (HPr) family protein